MNIIEVPVKSLKPYGKNPRKNDKAVEYVANSIRRFGFKQPIVIDSQYEIVCGHTRWKASKVLGLETVPCVMADDLTPEEIAVYRLADNKTAEVAEWDFDLLEDEFNMIDPEEFDLSDFGFFQDAEEPEKAPADIVEDEVPEIDENEVPCCKRGQIWQLGNHRLMCGDSTSSDDVAMLMNGEKADMVFTDPPYGVAIGDKNAMLNSVQPSGRCCTNIEGDTMSESELYDMLKSAFINVRENCKDDACYYVTSPQGGSLGLMMMMMKDAGLEVRHVLMWRKNTATFSLGRLDYDYQHEPIFYTWTKSHHNYRKGKYRTTIWDFDKPRKCDLHPTMKPVGLVANAMLDGTKEGDNVLDSFGGSGTTLIASEQLDRRCFMMELDPHYCDVIIKRWEDFTGRKAELLEE